MLDITKLDFAEFKLDYTELIVNNMSHSQLITFACEMIYNNLNNISEEQIEEDFIEVFGEEKLQELITQHTTAN